MSNSLQPQGLQPTRLLCPRDFPGKSTGVGCHCLLRPISIGRLYCAGYCGFSQEGSKVTSKPGQFQLQNFSRKDLQLFGHLWIDDNIYLHSGPIVDILNKTFIVNRHHLFTVNWVMFPFWVYLPLHIVIIPTHGSSIEDINAPIPVKEMGHLKKR